METKTKIIFLLLLTLGTNNLLRAQDFELTKPRMYEDFDSLVSMISYFNPHLEIYKKAMHYDVLDNIKQMRPRIEDIKDIFAYFFLLNRCLDLIPEVHAKMLGMNEKMILEYADTTQLIPAVIRPEDVRYMVGLYQNLMKEEKEYYSNVYPISLTIRYIEGRYYFARPHLIINQEDSFACKTGDRITRINGIPISTFISENHRNYYDKLRWDVYNHCFWTNFPLWTDRFPQTTFPFTSITIGKDDGKEYELPFNRDTHFWIDSDDLIKKEDKVHFKPYDRKPVLWLKDSLLYIKIPMMNPGDLEVYSKRIRQLCRHKTVGNVILDVRRNGGGSDKVWEKVLSLLTDVPLTRNQILCVNNPKICRDYILGDRDSTLFLNDTLLSRKFMIIDAGSRVVAAPDKKSICCKGKIYVLHDEDTYSAANTLVTFALNCDKLIAVGTPVGYLSGYGVDPFVFQLPVSKFLFMMHSVIHIPEKAHNVESYLWNSTEIRVIPTIRYVNVFEENRQSDILYQYDFLKEYDPYFKAVLNDINKR